MTRREGTALDAIQTAADAHGWKLVFQRDWDEARYQRTVHLVAQDGTKLVVYFTRAGAVHKFHIVPAARGHERVWKTAASPGKRAQVLAVLEGASGTGQQPPSGT